MNLPTLTIGDLTARLPIIQGGMGVGISLHRLASAVANEGGIGVIAGAMIGMREPDVAKNPTLANSRALAAEIEKARELTDGILGVNVMVALTDFSNLVRTAISSRANIIFSGAGLPLDLPKHLLDMCQEKKEDFSTKLVPIISSARATTILCKKWMSRFGYLPDAFVVEGPKAGGHLGIKPESIYDVQFALETVIPEVIDAVKPFEDKYGKSIPVIAAGGIFSGQDIYNFIHMGASGVQLGTRFVATEECDADIRFKQAFVDATEKDIRIIKSPVGLPGRAIQSRFLDALEEGKKNFKCIFQCISTCNPETSPYCIAQALLNAMKGNLERGFAFSGVNAFRINGIVTVKELMNSLQYEFVNAKDSLSENINNLQKEILSAKESLSENMNTLQQEFVNAKESLSEKLTSIK